MKSKLTIRRCKYCNEHFQQIQPLQYLCLPPNPCSWKYQEVLTANKKAKEERDYSKQCRAERKAYYDKHKKLSAYESEARTEFQKWIRLRDFGLPCISCGCLNAKQWDGGHFLKAELFTGLIFNEKNCHKQCSVCNDHKSGNELEYRDGLIARYGLPYVDQLEAIKKDNRQYKFTKQELIDIKETYKNKLKQLQQ